jgi:hypothetical protein
MYYQLMPFVQALSEALISSSDFYYFLWHTFGVRNVVDVSLDSLSGWRHTPQGSPRINSFAFDTVAV